LVNKTKEIHAIWKNISHSLKRIPFSFIDLISFYLVITIFSFDAVHGIRMKKGGKNKNAINPDFRTIFQLRKTPKNPLIIISYLAVSNLQLHLVHG
jgi:hypothetical protein